MTVDELRAEFERASRQFDALPPHMRPIVTGTADVRRNARAVEHVNEVWTPPHRVGECCMCAKPWPCPDYLSRGHIKHGAS